MASFEISARIPTSPQLTTPTDGGMVPPKSSGSAIVASLEKEVATSSSLGKRLLDSAESLSHSGSLSKVAKGLKVGSGVLDATTGIVSVVRTFQDERARGDFRHQGTMEVILGSVTQNAVSGAVGTTVAAALGVGFLPVVAGIGAGMAAGYAVGVFFDWLRD